MLERRKKLKFSWLRKKTPYFADNWKTQKYLLVLLSPSIGKILTHSSGIRDCCLGRNKSPCMWSKGCYCNFSASEVSLKYKERWMHVLGKTRKKKKNTFELWHFKIGGHQWHHTVSLTGDFFMKTALSNQGQNGVSQKNLLILIKCGWLKNAIFFIVNNYIHLIYML